jgi:hypothetical protein
LLGCCEFTNRDASRLFLIFEDCLVKVVDPFFVTDAKSGDAVLRLDFFDIKAETLDTRILEEVIDLLGVTKGITGNHGDDVKGIWLSFNSCRPRMAVRWLPSPRLVLRCRS